MSRIRVLLALFVVAMTTLPIAVRPVRAQPSPSFEIWAVPNDLELLRGGVGTFHMAIISQGGFSGNIILSSTIAPGTRSVKISLSPTSLTLPSSASVIVTIDVSHSDKAVGDYIVTVTGTSGAITSFVTIRLTVATTT